MKSANWISSLHTVTYGRWYLFTFRQDIILSACSLLMSICEWYTAYSSVQ